MKHLQLAIGYALCPVFFCGRRVQAQTKESTPGREWFATVPVTFQEQ